MEFRRKVRRPGCGGGDGAGCASRSGQCQRVHPDRGRGAKCVRPGSRRDPSTELRSACTWQFCSRSARSSTGAMASGASTDGCSRPRGHGAVKGSSCDTCSSRTTSRPGAAPSSLPPRSRGPGRPHGHRRAAEPRPLRPAPQWCQLPAPRRAGPDPPPNGKSCKREVDYPVTPLRRTFLHRLCSPSRWGGTGVSRAAAHGVAPAGSAAMTVSAGHVVIDTGPDHAGAAGANPDWP